MTRYPERGSREDEIGETVELELPPARGGKQRLKVILGSSCSQCALQGLGHGLCKEVKCLGQARSDGRDVVYQKVEDDDE